MTFTVYVQSPNGGHSVNFTVRVITFAKAKVTPLSPFSLQFTVRVIAFAKAKAMPLSPQHPRLARYASIGKKHALRRSCFPTLLLLPRSFCSIVRQLRSLRAVGGKNPPGPPSRPAHMRDSRPGRLGRALFFCTGRSLPLFVRLREGLNPHVMRMCSKCLCF